MSERVGILKREYLVFPSLLTSVCTFPDLENEYAYNAWVNAAVSGYFCYWISQGAMAPAEYGYRYFNAGERIVTRGAGNTGYGMVTYIHI